MLATSLPVGFIFVCLKFFDLTCKDIGLMGIVFMRLVRFKTGEATSVISALVRVRQEDDHRFEVSEGYK